MTLEHFFVYFIVTSVTSLTCSKIVPLYFYVVAKTIRNKSKVYYTTTVRTNGTVILRVVYYENNTFFLCTFNLFVINLYSHKSLLDGDCTPF